MAETSIEWTDATWNPVAGCTIVSAGCTNCYAMRMASRLDAMGVEKYRDLTRKSGNRSVWTGHVTLDESALNVPLRWRRPRKIFVNSMSDLFQEAVPAFFIRKIWDVMQHTPHHIYQVLTKRSDRMKTVLSGGEFPLLPNVWLGTSVEDGATIKRLDDLRQTPAAIRFVSFEPLIESVADADLRQIDWAIVGGESGPRARPIDEIWVSEIQSMCREHSTAFFFKQWGGRNKKVTGRSYQGRTWDDLPELRI
jgi:protein gp37